MALIPTIAPEDYRRKIAYKLMQQGSSGEPVQHWAQGLAKLAQGALGGYQMYQADEKDKADLEGAAQMRIALLGGGGMGAPQAAPEAPAMPTPSRPMANTPAPMVGPDPQAMTGPRPGGPVQPTAKVWGDAEAEAAGLYEPQPKNVRMASALAQPGIPAQAPMPAAPPQMAQALAQPPQQVAQAAPQDPRMARVIQYLQTGTPAQKREAMKYADVIAAQQMQGSKPTDEIREFEYAQRNPAFKDYKTGMKRAGAIQNNVVIDQKGELEFSKTAGKKQAERFDELAAEAPKAKQMISDVKTLTELGTQIGTGKMAEAKAVIGPYASAIGVDVKGLDEIQAFEAIVNRVAPNLRVPGSGAQSDYELKNFLKSLPKLGNTPEGNALASKVMEGLYQNKIKAAEIGAAAISGEMTRANAEKALRDLPDPMKEWRDATKGQKSETKPGGQVQDGALAHNPKTGETLIRRGGKWVSQL